jgi:hypothetical protein
MRSLLADRGNLRSYYLLSLRCIFKQCSLLPSVNAMHFAKYTEYASDSFLAAKASLSPSSPQVSQT